MFVEVSKLDLMEGEEVLELGGKIMQALSQNRKKLKRSLSLRGVFNDHVVTKDMETGKLFRMTLKRASDGSIVLGQLEEVRQIYVPIKQQQKQAEGYVCPECGAKADKPGKCAKCGATLEQQKSKTEKSVEEDYDAQAQWQMHMLDAIEDVTKGEGTYVDLRDPDLDPKESLFKGIV